MDNGDLPSLWKCTCPMLLLPPIVGWHHCLNDAVSGSACVSTHGYEQLIFLSYVWCITYAAKGGSRRKMYTYTFAPHRIPVLLQKLWKTPRGNIFAAPQLRVLRKLHAIASPKDEGGHQTVLTSAIAFW